MTKQQKKNFTKEFIQLISSEIKNSLKYDFQDYTAIVQETLIDLDYIETVNLNNEEYISHISTLSYLKDDSYNIKNFFY